MAEAVPVSDFSHKTPRQPCRRTWGLGAVVWILATAAGLFYATLAHAQINRGIIEGTLTDPNAAVVPNGDVTITSVGTGVAVSTKTNNVGYYRVVDLVPGTYRAQFKFRGFAALEIAGIEVGAGRVIRVDGELKLETTRQSVEIQAEVTLVDTGASNFNTTLETRTISDLPLLGRDLQQLVFLLPGVTSPGGPPGSNFGFNSQFGTFPDPTYALGSNVSVSGGQGSANAWYLDGSMNASSFSENVAVNPSVESVEEFQAVTNGVAAEYGRTGGGVFNVVLKSGTNALHGSVYHFLRNDATNARNPFTSIDSFGKLIKERQLRFNDSGGTLGGPVYLPKIYNGKNRSFFFFSFDQSILHLLGQRTFTVPTTAMRAGDFSEDANVVNNGIWDPFTTVGPDSKGLYDRLAFGDPVPGNPLGDKGCWASSVAEGRRLGVNTCKFATSIPSNRFDPLSMYFVKSYPMPNYLSPTSTAALSKDGYRISSNYLATVGSSLTNRNFVMKFDHQISNSNKLFVEWLPNPSDYRNYRVPWTGATFPYAGGFRSQYPVDIRNHIVTVGDTYTVRPTVINEARFTYSQQYLTTNPSQPYPDEITDQKAVAEKLAASKIPIDPKYFPIPNFSVGGQQSFGPVRWVNMNTSSEAYTILDNVTKVLGKHTLKTGFIYRLEHALYESGFPATVTFSGSQVKNVLTGQGAPGLAQFMLGAVGGGMAGLMWPPATRFRYWGFYVQDDFRVTPQLTLNIGLRYDINGLFAVTNAKPNSNFCLGCMNEVTGMKGKVIYQGDKDWFGGGQDIAPPNWNNLGPRINFAWTPFKDRKTVIRGGYDVFSSNAFSSLNAPGQSASNSPGWNQQYDWTGSWSPTQCGPISGNCPKFRFSDTTVDKASLTVPPMAKDFPAQRRESMIGIGFLQFFEKPSHDPMVQSWNLDVQRELPGNMMVSVGYVGSHGTHLVGESFRQYNYVHTKDRLKYRTTINEVVPIRSYFSGSIADKLEQVSGRTSLPRNMLLVDYPFYGASAGLQNQTAFDGTSIYHSGTLRVQKRFSNGFNYIVAYTFSKKIDNASTAENGTMLVDPIHGVGAMGGRSLSYSRWQDPDNKRLDRSISADDITHVFNVAGVWELPFGNGKAFLNRKGAADFLAGGWRLSANMNAQSGVPMAINGPCNQVTCRPNLVGNPSFSGDRSKLERINQWFDPAAFQPVFGTDTKFWQNYSPQDDRAWVFGTLGARMPWARSPGFWNVDSSLGKRFQVREQKYFEFRWEVFNALNHMNLGYPSTGWCLPRAPDGTTDAVRQQGCAFGRISNIQTDPRAMQFGLKFKF